MQRIYPAIVLSLAMSYATAMSLELSAGEPVSLMGTITKWRYPDAEIGKAEMSDGATIGADGNRTESSSVLKTTMVTSDSVDKVLAFYRDLLSAPRRMTLGSESNHR